MGGSGGPPTLPRDSVTVGKWFPPRPSPKMHLLFVSPWAPMLRPYSIHVDGCLWAQPPPQQSILTSRVARSRLVKKGPGDTQMSGNVDSHRRAPWQVGVVVCGEKAPRSRQRLPCDAIPPFFASSTPAPPGKSSGRETNQTPGSQIVGVARLAESLGSRRRHAACGREIDNSAVPRPKPGS